MNTTQLTGLDTSQQKVLGTAGPDARRMRKAIFRRTIDYNASIMNYLRDRVWQFSSRSRVALQPDYLYNYLLGPPNEYLNSPMNCVTGKLVRTSTNKNKCPIYCVCWTPEGRRLITGAYTGEFTLWNGLTFNFETILQAHEAQIRCMKWSHNDDWLLTADHAGYVKYWQANMNNVQVYQAHKMPIRGVSFSPCDTKFVTCSDDATVRIWDFFRCHEERALRASRDHLIKLFDLRYMRTELQTFRGHKKEVTRVAWHSCHESLFASGSGDGAIHFWCAGTETELGVIDDAHDNMIWSLAWHPLGHILVSGGNDFTTKFWTRNRPGDILKDVNGTGNTLSGITNVLPAISSEDLVTDVLGESLSRSMHDTPMESDAQSSALEPPSGEALVEIPGLNDGLPGPLAPEDEQESDVLKNRPLSNRPPGSISKEFMANWSSSRIVHKTGVVLSAVAAAKESNREACGTANKGPLGSEILVENQNKMDMAHSRSVSTPLVTSDMCMNPKAKAAASEAAEYDARFKGRKFDSAAREEEMLAFANSLMPPSPPRPPPQPPPPPPPQQESHSPIRPPNQPLSSRYGPPPPQRFMGGPPPRYPSSGYLPSGPSGPPFRRPPMPFRPPYDHQWGGPGPYNGPPPPPGYGGPPPPKRQAMQRPPPQMRRGW